MLVVKVFAEFRLKQITNPNQLFQLGFPDSPREGRDARAFRVTFVVAAAATAARVQRPLRAWPLHVPPLPLHLRDASAPPAPSAGSAPTTTNSDYLKKIASNSRKINIPIRLYRSANRSNRRSSPWGNPRRAGWRRHVLELLRARRAGEARQGDWATTREREEIYCVGAGGGVAFRLWPSPFCLLVLVRVRGVNSTTALALDDRRGPPEWPDLLGGRPPVGWSGWPMGRRSSQ
jgi:hypothetical protein